MTNDILESLEWMVEVTLATVDDYAMKAKPPKREYDRQRSIAQRGINDLCAHRDSLRKEGRVRKVIEQHGGSVSLYADAIRAQFYPAAKSA